MSAEVGEPIPWSYTDAPGLLLWSWVTEHFAARIVGAEVTEPTVEHRLVRTYSWEIGDLIRPQQGMPRVLVEGSSPTFEEAERHIREHTGKLYDPGLGYRRYSGSLAFSYTLTTGVQVDVSEYIGSRCGVTVLMPDGSERTVSGEFQVSGYTWTLTTADQVLEIRPEHVVRIGNRSEVADRAVEITRNSSYSGFGRIYREEPRMGCTGRPGFTVGTVDHAGAPRCPIHEVGLPDRLLV
jgi:hypothetical protein